MKPDIIGMSSDGEVQVMIGNVTYHYIVDTGHYPYIRKMIEYQPWRILNFLKRTDICKKYWKEEI